MGDGFGRGYRREDLFDDFDRALTSDEPAREGVGGSGRGGRRAHPMRSCRAGHFRVLRPALELALAAIMVGVLFGFVAWLVFP